jgi:lysophospholipase L1-like esterase
MKYQIAAIGLAPLIIAQGLYVRWITPRLPEPEGERSGITGSGSPLSLLILGDSAAAGVGVSTQSQALSGQLVALLRADFQVSWKLLAQTGRTAQEIARQLTAETPDKFDIVVTSVGVNDVTHGTNNKKWLDQQKRIIELLTSKFHSRHILMSSIPPMHLFPALPQPLRWYLGRRAKRLNGELKKMIAGDRQCEFVAVDFPLEATYMAGDGFHPGAIAYRIWADHLAGIIRRRLA